LDLFAAVPVSAMMVSAVLNVSVATRGIIYVCRFTVTKELCLLRFNAMQSSESQRNILPPSTELKGKLSKNQHEAGSWCESQIPIT
jgi:hypothetical protein